MSDDHQPEWLRFPIALKRLTGQGQSDADAKAFVTRRLQQWLPAMRPDAGFRLIGRRRSAHSRYAEMLTRIKEMSVERELLARGPLSTSKTDALEILGKSAAEGALQWTVRSQWMTDAGGIDWTNSTIEVPDKRGHYRVTYIEISAQELERPVGAQPAQEIDVSPSAPPGPKVGKLTPKRQVCEAAVKMLEGRIIPPGHGRLTEIAKRLHKEFPDYQVDTISRMIGRDGRDWEDSHPDL
jgi:hypothetical protein